MMLPMELSEGSQYFGFDFKEAVGRGYEIAFTSGRKTQSVEFSLDDSSLLYRNLEEMPKHIADLIDLACAIYVTDGLSKHDLSKAIRQVYLRLPLREPHRMRSQIDRLKDLLWWTTQSDYHFEFVQRKATPRKSESQSAIPIIDKKNTDVMLWSGGLDALAGCYNRLKQYPERCIVLVGTGGNPRVSKVQKDIYYKLHEEFSRVKLYQIPTQIEAKAVERNKLMRARGVVFLLLGFAAAYLMGNHRLHVFENGVGAMNLPYLRSSVGLDHVRSVHPRTLDKVARLVSAIVGERFGIINPAIFQTKSQMCEALKKDGRTDLVSITESCDSYHRKSYGQCGYCSSCLLRRLSLIAAGIKEDRCYVIPHGTPPKRDPKEAFKAMSAQVRRLDNIFTNHNDHNEQWQHLTGLYLDLDSTVDELFPIKSQLSVFNDLPDARHSFIRMYKRYVQEWKQVAHELSIGITDWKKPTEVLLH